MAKKRRNKAEYGDGSIYPEKDGTYRIAVRLKPNAKPTRRRAPDRATAEVVKANLLKLRDEGIVEDSEGLDTALDTLQRLRDDYIDVEAGLQLFSDFIERWFNDVVKRRTGITERTLDHYRSMIRLYLLPAFGPASLIQIKPPHVSQFLNNLQDHLAPGTVKHAYSTLRQALDTAVAWRYIPYNPARSVEAPKVKRAQKAPLTVKQVRTLLDTVAGHPTAAIFHTMATLGTRLGETLALRRIDFNTDFTEVKIAEQISYHSRKRAKPKDESVRLLPVPPRLSARLKALWLSYDNKWHGLLFPSEVGTPFQPSNVEKLWNGYTQRRPTKKGIKEYKHKGFKEKAELPDATVMHDLRSFVATMLGDADIDQRIIGHVLGHGAKNVTEKYMRRHLPTLRRALEKLEDILWNSAIDSQIDSQHA